MNALLVLTLAPVIAVSAPDNSAAEFALMGVRLSMSPAQTAQVLKVESQAIEELAVPCPQPPSQGCRSIRATLPDGSMDILFQNSPGGPVAVRIALTVKGRGERDRDRVLAAAIEHYGPPTLDEPAWCALDTHEQRCRDDAPSMVFSPLAGAAGQFILAAPSDGDP